MKILKNVKFKFRFFNEDGNVMIVVLLLLALLTFLGMSASTNSKIEVMLSGVEKEKTGAFFAAEAGMAHIRTVLTSRFKELATPKMMQLQVRPDTDPGQNWWSFALGGSEGNTTAATAFNYAGGAKWLLNGGNDTGTTLSSGYTYKVRVWNNSDGGSATVDNDCLINVRASASAPNNRGCT